MANVLIVDDSKLIIRVLGKIVTESGHNVVATGNDGLQGIELYNSHKPDLVLLDITMPNKSGKECLADILAESPHAKIIMFSSVADENTRKDCLQIGAKAYLKKEVNMLDPNISKHITDTINLVLAA